MMMRSESKEIYGVNIISVLAVLHQARRWWTLRDLRRAWRDDYFFAGLVQQRGWFHVADTFAFDSRYKRIRMFAKAYQCEGVI